MRLSRETLLRFTAASVGGLFRRLAPHADWKVPLSSREGPRAGPGTHHDAREQADALPTVGVGHHVPVADGQERDGDEPHGTQEVACHVLLVMVPADGKTGVGWGNRRGWGERLWADVAGEGKGTICRGRGSAHGDAAIPSGD